MYKMYSFRTVVFFKKVTVGLLSKEDLKTYWAVLVMMEEIVIVIEFTQSLLYIIGWPHTSGCVCCMYFIIALEGLGHRH